MHNMGIRYETYIDQIYEFGRLYSVTIYNNILHRD